MGDYRPPTGIQITEPDPAWPDMFDAIAAQIRSALGDRALGIDHVGSTSVPGLPAKPIIDIDVTVRDSSDEASYVPDLERAGFRLVVREPWWHEHRCLVGSDPSCNVHVFSPDAAEPIRHRIFRDWLRSNPDDRALYTDVKRRAAETANGAGEHVMDYNARKQSVIWEIYDRAFRAAGLLHDTALGTSTGDIGVRRSPRRSRGAPALIKNRLTFK